MSRHVAFVVHAGRPDAVELAETTASQLGDRGIVVDVVELRRSLEVGEIDVLDGLNPDLLVSLGGDGTFLRTARRAHEVDAPVLGVNFGRVGYLLNMAPDDLHGTVIEALEGSIPVEERTGLLLSVDGAGEWFVVNEVSLEKTVPGHVVRIATEIDGEAFLTFAADGVLVATPTGSTAYNLSAGGPVLAPGIDGFVMTPVAPHFVLDRSVVLGGAQSVRLGVVGDRPAVCVVDGMSVATLEPGRAITCSRHPRRLKVVVLAEVGLGQRLRESLRQGHE
jgi:NAD+ kinase